MKELFKVTKIDKNDKVSREYVTATSKRDKVFRDDAIVKIEKVAVIYPEIEKALTVAELPEHIIAHVMNVLTNE